MEYVSQTLSGAELNNFIKLPPLLRNRRVQIIVLPAEGSIEENIKNEAEINYKCNIGCCPELPELPISFFEPLPEEDLQAWGL